MSSDMRITLANVTPITNFYKISQKIKSANKIYMKIIKLIKSLDQEIMKPQQAKAQKPQVFGSIPQNNSINLDQNQDQNQNLNFEHDQKINNNQIEQQGLEFFDKKEQNTIQNYQKENYADFLNQNDEQKQDSDQLKTINVEQPVQQSQIKKSRSDSPQREDNNLQNLQVEDAYNDQLSDLSEDYSLCILDLFYCKQLLRKDDKKIKKLVKQIKKYSQKKLELEKEYVSNNTLSSSYIAKCNSIQQKNLLLIFLKPPNPFKRFFQKAKYIFRSKYSTYSLNRYYPQDSTHLNINWQTIGIELQDKQIKQIIVTILGFVQFFICFQILIFIYDNKSENDSNQDDVKIQYLKKALFALSMTIFYLICEKLYDYYSNHMITSMNSKRILLYMQNLFFFYSLYYIVLPLLNVFAYGVIQLSSTDNEQDFSPFTKMHPFQIFVTNFVVAASLFSAKSIFPIKLFNKKIIQMYYLKSKRYLKKTQYELNKIFRRQKFRLEDCTLSLFNLLVISIPFTFCLPILLILPIFYLFIMYFAFKYQYLMALRPGYYCKSINKKTSSIFANYIQRISFFSYIFFTSNIFILFSGFIFYIVYAITEIIINFYIKHNFRQRQASRYDFINNMMGHFQTEKKTELNTQLSQAVDQYQYFTQSVSQNSIQSRVFYYNQQQLCSNQQSDQLSQADSQLKMQAGSDSQFNTKQNKKLHYSFMLQYQKYKFIQDQSKLFHCQKF
ncbi:hypothetical protein ABPG72_007783 [Tetrahymena utriculariae]